ncbi:MAG: HAD-IIB family hydrolase [Thermoanaerobaculia bacterium]
MLVVFTDLDGTLLEEDGSLSPEAKAALDALGSRGVRVVPLTSKTRRELSRCLEELGGEHWGAFENGAGLLTPSGAEILPGAVPVDRLRDILRHVRDETHLAIRSVEEMSDEELAERTGLPLLGIPLVRAREFDLPFCAPEGGEEAISRALEGRPGTRLTKGDRFFHLLGRHDKADAVRRFVELLRPSRTIGLGDAPNDVSFLRVVDHPVLVPRKAGVDAALRAALPHAAVAPAPAGAGWSVAVRALVADEKTGF